MSSHNFGPVATPWAVKPHPQTDESKTYQPLGEWLEILESDFGAFCECCWLWNSWASSAARNAKIADDRKPQTITAMVGGKLTEVNFTPADTIAGLFGDLSRFISLTRLLVTWCDTKSHSGIDAEPLDDVARFIQRMDSNFVIQGDADFRLALREAFERSRAITRRMLNIASLRSDAPPPAEQLITKKQMANLVKKSVSRINNIATDYPLPEPIGKKGREFLFQWSEIYLWLKEQLQSNEMQLVPKNYEDARKLFGE